MPYAETVHTLAEKGSRKALPSLDLFHGLERRNAIVAARSRKVEKMQLTRFTDYSLRVLMFLAARPDRLARIEEVAEAYGISRGHVMKVVRGLGHHGFIESQRGRGGGVRLSRPASEIGLGDVVRKTEENVALVECLGDHGSCVIAPACGMKNALASALEAFFYTLDEYTLQDLVAQPRKMARLLQIA